MIVNTNESDLARVYHHACNLQVSSSPERESSGRIRKHVCLRVSEDPLEISWEIDHNATVTTVLWFC